MKFNLHYLLVILFSCSLFAQQSFEKGYYIDGHGRKTEGLIKIVNFDDINFNENAGLVFKTTPDGPETKIPKSDVQEFAIENSMKYQKVTVMIDEANLYKDYTLEKDFTFISKTLFFNIIAEGEATLYSYESENGTKFFFKTSKENKIQQLKYKKYTTVDNLVKENSAFRQQLFENVKCPDQEFNAFLTINYSKESLLPVFNNYNKCSGNPSVVYNDKLKKKIKIKFTAFAGMHNSTFKVVNTDPKTSETVSKMTPGFGVEVELIGPSEKWAAFLSAEYENLNADVFSEKPSSMNPNITNQHYVLKSNSINFCGGIRRYFNTGKTGNIVIDAAVGFNSPKGNLKKYNTPTPSNPNEVLLANNDIRVNTYYSFGIGYVYRNKIGVTLKMDTAKNLVPNVAIGLGTKNTRFGINLRYTFL